MTNTPHALRAHVEKLGRYSDRPGSQRDPALMVTDTAFYRYPYDHTAFDTPDRIDYDSFARVTEGLSGTIAALACR